MSVILNKLSNPKLATGIKAGQVGVIPSDTIFGVVCAAADEAAVERLYAL
jgi:tRNA A37 threonylcarbamoyladenosine synthetase subunit TsaC/SUA5/YrdC